MPNNPWALHIAARMEALLVESKSIANSFGHNGIRGSIREVFVKQFLEPFLPPQVGIGTGEIINHEGKRSRQLDVVLYNKNRVPPTLLSGSDTGVFPWECVVLVMEVKSKLTVSAVQHAHINANSVAQIYSNLEEKDILVGGLRPLEGMFPYGPIPYYVFAFDSDLTESDKKSKIQYGSNTSLIGKEGSRLLNVFNSLIEKRHPHVQVISSKNSTKHEIEKAKRHLSKIGGVDNHSSSGAIHGVCVAGREWTQGHVSFESKVFSQYSNEPIRIMSKWNYQWDSVFNRGSMEDVLALLAHIIELSYEMPKCREHYNIARYLVS